jgi:hypothetical protein
VKKGGFICSEKRQVPYSNDGSGGEDLYILVAKLSVKVLNLTGLGLLDSFVHFLDGIWSRYNPLIPN